MNAYARPIAGSVLPRRFVLLSCLLPLSGCFLGDRVFHADSRLPSRVREISIESQQRGTGLEEVCAQIRATYGEPAREAGSIERWSIDGGILTCDPVAGLFFVTPESETIRVVRKQNPLRESLLGSYSMATKRDASHQYESYWLGNMRLRANGTYGYEDSGQFLGQRADQTRNFFMRHTSGTYQLLYLDGLGPTTLVESIHGHKRVAKLTFRASDGTEKTYFIARKPSWGGRLVFESDKDIEFVMEMSW